MIKIIKKRIIMLKEYIAVLVFVIITTLIIYGIVKVIFYW